MPRERRPSSVCGQHYCEGARKSFFTHLRRFSSTTAERICQRFWSRSVCAPHKLYVFGDGPKDDPADPAAVPRLETSSQE